MRYETQTHSICNMAEEKSVLSSRQIMKLVDQIHKINKWKYPTLDKQNKIKWMGRFDVMIRQSMMFKWILWWIEKLFELTKDLTSDYISLVKMTHHNHNFIEFSMQFKCIFICTVFYWSLNVRHFVTNRRFAQTYSTFFQMEHK